MLGRLLVMMMTRTERLMRLLQTLRNHRYAVTAEWLAKHFDISVRTVYRDIELLRFQGAEIEGDAGVGFMLKRGLLLPPLMFDENEIEALVLGVRWVETLPDPDLRTAATSILNKLMQTLPIRHQQLLDSTTLFAKSDWHIDNASVMLQIRLAVRLQEKCTIAYQDEKGEASARIIWPVTLGYFRDTPLLAAWCELRSDFRHFRLDRITRCERLQGHQYPQEKRVLFRQWRKTLKQHADTN